MEIKNKELKSALCQIKGAALRLYKEPAVIILFLVFVLVSVFSHELYAIVLWLLLVLGWYWGVAVFGAERPRHPEESSVTSSDTSTHEKCEDTPVREKEDQQDKKPAKKDTAQVVEKEEAKAEKTQNEPKEQPAPKAKNKDATS